MYESDEDDFDVDFGIMKQALHVEFPSDFNPNKVPQNGEEYLHHVIYERSKQKEWVTAEFDRDKFKDKQTFRVALEDTSHHHNNPFLPSAEWQKNKLEEFGEFREYLIYKDCIESNVTEYQQSKFIKDVVVDKKIPVFTEVVKYTSVVKTCMISALVKILKGIPKGGSIDKVVGAWIYSLLLLQEIPLSPDTHSSLRSISRACIKLRSELPPDSEEITYAPLNLFICIVGRYFNQFDLADPY